MARHKIEIRSRRSCSLAHSRSSYKAWYRLLKFSKHRVSSTSRCVAPRMSARDEPRESKTEAGFDKDEVEERSKRDDDDDGERGRMRRHSSGAGKRHDGISEIAPDIFACSVYIYRLPVRPCLLVVLRLALLIHFL